MKRTRALLAIGCACFVPFSLVACDDASAPAATTGAAGTDTTAPKDVIAPDAKVAAGLTGLKRLATDVSTQSDSAAAKRKAAGLEGFWAPVEGTVKRNEPDLYSTIEEDLSLLESGDPSKTKTGAREMGDTVDAYLTKHPG